MLLFQNLLEIIHVLEKYIVDSSHKIKFTFIRLQLNSKSTLEEEKAADLILTEVAEEGVNYQASEES